MRRLVLTLGLAVAATACSSRDVSLYLELPPHDGARAMIVAVEQGAGLSLTALNIETGSTKLTLPSAVLGSGDSARISALLYPGDLASLKLDAGAVPKATPGDERARPLPTTNERWVADLDLTSADAPTWQPLGGLSAALDNYRLPPADTPCAEFDVQIELLDTEGNGMFAVAIDQNMVLAATEDGRLYALDRLGNHTLVPIYDAVRNNTFTGGLIGAFFDGNDLWLGGNLGELLRTTFDGTTVTIHERYFSPAGGSIHWITGHSDSESTELFLLTGQGQLSRFDGSRFEVIRDFEAHEGLDWKGGLANVARGEIVAVFAFNPSVVRVKDGVVSDEAIDQDGAMHTITQVPVIGTVIGTSEGSFYRQTNGRWEPIPGSKLTVWNLGLHPYEDGFVFSGAFDNFGQWKMSYDENGGYCPISMPTGFEGRHFAVLGDDLFMVGNNPNTSNTPYGIFHRRH